MPPILSALALLFGAPAPPPAFADSNADFALDLFRRAGAERPGNVVVGPYSVSSALGMTFAGARGDTAAEMAKALRFRLPPAELHPAFASATRHLTEAGNRRGQTLAVANALWGQRGLPFRPEFLATAREQYAGALREVDYRANPDAATAEINAWANEQTRGKIPRLLQQGDVTPLTRMVLTNAVYFKGLWADSFAANATRPEPFESAPGAKKPVPTMHARRKLAAFEDADRVMVRLPYKSDEPGRGLEMVLVLPKTRHDLTAALAGLGGEAWNRSVSAAKPRDVELSLPKYKYRSRFQLADALKAMGMVKAFDPNAADFGAMTEADQLHVARVVHEATVEVDEEGTVAAAATAVVMATRAAHVADAPLEFRCDQPFAFFVRDAATGAILFAGRVADPAAE